MQILINITASKFVLAILMCFFFEIIRAEEKYEIIIGEESETEDITVTDKKSPSTDNEVDIEDRNITNTDTDESRENPDSLSTANEPYITGAGSYTSNDTRSLKPLHSFGLGIGGGFHFFYSMKINEYLEEVWEALKDEYLKRGYDYIIEEGTTSLFLGYCFNIHVRIDPIPYLYIAPKLEIFYAPKTMILNSDEIMFSLNNYYFGSIIAGVIRPRKTLSAKIGANFGYAKTKFEIEEYNTITYSGSGFYFSLILGLMFNPGDNARVAINIDLLGPIYSTDLKHKSGNFGYADTVTRNIRPPSTVSLNGFQIRPGVTIRF